MLTPQIIHGQEFSDNRGKLIAFNDLDLTEVVRSYEVLPKSESIIRAWQAHRHEKKWFYCKTGSFLVHLIKIDNFDAPADNLSSHQFHLNAKRPQILMIPGGYANGFKALEPDSSLQVYSNFTLQQSAGDDYRFSEEKWAANWQLLEEKANEA